jgi:alpha-beta hydrolase superfamily lysophospholipase
MSAVLLLILALMATVAFAQEAVEPQEVQVEAADGLMLVGDFYVLDAEKEAPTVLLMHMLNSRRSAWDVLIPSLLEGGYNVLNVDLRGHGDSSGARSWTAATADVQTWLDWLREQPGVRDDAIALIGGSIGSNLALVGCANDPACTTAIALSPGLDYFGVMPQESVTDGLEARSALLVASQRDSYSADSVKQMLFNATGDIGARIYSGRRHGTDMLLGDTYEPLTTLILAWLDEHTPEVE